MYVLNILNAQTIMLHLNKCNFMVKKFTQQRERIHSQNQSLSSINQESLTSTFIRVLW